MISAYTQVKCFFRYPEIRQDLVSILLIQRRKHQHEGRNIRGRRQVQSAVADAPLQIVFGDRKRTGVPLVHRHSADRLLHPLIQPKLPFSLSCRKAFSSPGFCFADSQAASTLSMPTVIQREIGLFPHLRISPILIRFRTVNDRIESWIDLPAVEDALCFLVDFITNGVCIISGSSNQEIQWLHSGIAGAFSHYIKEFPIRLSVQLIKYHTVYIKTSKSFRLG